jgi:hypothetical protein
LETVPTLLPHRQDQPRRRAQPKPMSARAPTMHQRHCAPWTTRNSLFD